MTAKQCNLWVPGKPVPWARTTGGRHTPPRQRAAKKHIAWQARAVAPGCPVEGPVRLRIIFQYARPKKPTDAHAIGAPHYFKPDVDNLVKLVKDALTEAGWYRDDSQVAVLEAVKVWSEESGTTIQMEPILKENG